MTLYYFDIHNTVAIIQDETGFEFPDLTYAYKEALRSAREFFVDGDQGQEDMRFQITDATGKVVLCVPIQNLHKPPLAAKAATDR